MSLPIHGLLSLWLSGLAIAHLTAKERLSGCSLLRHGVMGLRRGWLSGSVMLLRLLGWRHHLSRMVSHGLWRLHVMHRLLLMRRGSRLMECLRMLMRIRLLNRCWGLGEEWRRCSLMPHGTWMLWSEGGLRGRLGMEHLRCECWRLHHLLRGRCRLLPMGKESLLLLRGRRRHGRVLSRCSERMGRRCV